MKLLAIPVLAAVLGQAGDDAEKVFRAMEEKVARADSFQVRFEGKLAGVQPKSPGGIYDGQVTAAGNKARIEATRYS